MSRKIGFILPTAYSLVPVRNSAPRQIIRRHLNADAVPNQDANSVLPHFSGDSREHDVLRIVELHFKESIGLLVDDRALCWNQIVSSQINSP